MLTVDTTSNSITRSGFGLDFGLTDATFARYQAMVYRVAGIWLNSSKKPLLLCRLAKRLRQIEIATFDHYFKKITSDPDERAIFFNLITTNETPFFREPRQFEYL